VSLTIKQLKKPERGHISFGFIPDPYWRWDAVIIVGAGPSLKGFDFQRLRGKSKVIAVNGAMYDTPFANAWLTLDSLFIRNHQQFLSQPGPPLFIGAPQDDWCGDPPFPPKIERATYLRITRHKVNMLSATTDQVTQGCTSGFMALNFAYIKRSTLIVLLGFDYSEDKDSHYCPERYPDRVARRSMWKAWIGHFDFVAPQLQREHVRVINASPDSAIKNFERMTHDQAFKEIDKFYWRTPDGH
jgi:hypothetical protein